MSQILSYTTPPRRRRWSSLALISCIFAYLAGPLAAAPFLILCCLTPRETPFRTPWLWITVAVIPIALIAPVILCKISQRRLLRSPALRGRRQLEVAIFASYFWLLFPIAPFVIPALILRPFTVMTIIRRLGTWRRAEDFWG